MQDTSHSVIVGDVGGTNARFAVAQVASSGAVELGTVSRLPTRDYAGFGDALQHWIDGLLTGGAELPRQAVFALAGPSGADEIHMTNLGWTVQVQATARRFGFGRVLLANDFAAQARAVPSLAPDRFETLVAGAGHPGEPIVVLGPGTGLGMAVLVTEGRGWRVQPTEGGHQSFAPMDARERAILELLCASMSYVRYEDLVSGPGLGRLYQCVCALEGVPARLCGAPEIGPAATSGDDPQAVEAARLLAMILATFAGNAVLATGARGGCVIAGGVAEALAPFLRTAAFTARMTERAPLASYFQGVPVRRVRDGFAALIGAALLGEPVA